MRVILLGAPGAGRGVQAQRLSEQSGLVRICTNGLLRDAAKLPDELGALANAALAQGRAISDDGMLALLQARLLRPDLETGFVLDGIPHTIGQAEALDTLFISMGIAVDCVISIEVDYDLLLQRLLGESTCSQCGLKYNFYTAPSKIDGQCDACGADLRHRVDDNETSVNSRLQVYRQRTLPIIEYYRTKQMLRIVQGIGEIEDINAAIKKIVSAYKPAATPAPTKPAKRPTAATPRKAATARTTKQTTPAVAEPVPTGEKRASSVKQKLQAKRMRKTGKKSAAKPTVKKKLRKVLGETKRVTTTKGDIDE